MKSTRFALISSITALILAAQLAPALAYEYVRCDTARETWRASLSAEGNGPEFGRWYYIGPFDSPEGRGFDAEYPPEKAIDLQASYEGKGGRTVRWQLGTRFRDGQENSLRIFGDDDWIAVYLYRTITAPEAQELPVLLGSDDSIIVWLNGERLLAHNVGRACTLGDERLTLRLNKGENQLLLKVCNGAGPSGFAFAVDQGPDTLIQRIARDFPLEINDLLVELDWIRQARQKKPTPGASVSVDDDAPGAVDGVKDGGTGFHTQLEEKPWWQVDLGSEYVLHRALLYNREDAGSRNNVLMMLLSSDGENWRQVWQNQGVLFHGAVDGKPMEVPLEGQKARYVRLQLPGREYLHLDEVEVFAADKPDLNIALEQPATQSSSSPWSSYTPPKKAGAGADDALFRIAAGEALELARKTLEFVSAARPLPDLAERLKLLEARVAEAKPGTDWQSLYLDVRRLRREMIVSHPLLDFSDLLITKRPPPLYSHMVDQYEGRHSRPGDGLVLLKSWRSQPLAVPLLADKLPVGSVLHPDLSYDGRRVVFSFCDHTVLDRNARQFFLYELDLVSGAVRQLTGVPGVDPLQGWMGRTTVLIEDFDPCYLPDGGIVFVSTRNQGFGRCHGGRYTPSYVLYRCDANGGNITRLSYGEANEWDPAVLPSGLIVYTRWDYINRHDTVLQSLWTTRPDGTAVAHYYGNSTRNPCMIAEAKPIPETDLVAATAMAHHSYTAGSIITIDRRHGEDGLDGVRRITPDASFPETEGWPVGSYSQPWPLSEDLYLAAYSPDRLVSQGNVQATEAYGIYLVDTLGGRELIYRDPKMSCFSPIPVQPRPVPPVLSSSLEPGRTDGTFLIQNVYDCVEPLIPGSIKRLRVVRMIEQPTASVPERSWVSQEITKGVVGTVPVEEDGSVAFRAPAQEPLLFQLLDENNMAVFSMRSQVYLQPGEVMSCAGCHEPRGSLAYGGQRLAPSEVKELVPSVGPRYAGGFSYARSVQPVLDRYCIRCHGVKRNAGDLNLLGTPKGQFSQSYEALVTRPGWVSLAHRNEQTDISKIMDYGSHAGKLARFLLNEHHRKAPIDPDSFTRIAEWLDLNGQYYGDYSFSRPERRKPSDEGVAALREHVKSACNECHEGMSEQPLEALVNVAIPEESRVLMSPLAESEGGWEQCRGLTWLSREDASYALMKAKVLGATGPAE